METADISQHFTTWGSAPERHVAAVRRVCRFIHENLDDVIDLNDLAKVAYISPFHLHRIFNRLLGENLKAYVRRLRLERSAYELKIGDKPIVNIALDAGYQAHETFTRAFRKRFGINPSAYRRKYGLLGAEPQDTTTDLPRWITPDEVKIQRLAEMHVAYLRITGPYGNCLSPDIPNSPWQLLVKALHMRGVGLESPKFLGICHDDPKITDQEHVRFDAAVLVPPTTVEPDSLINVATIEAGLYAVITHRGTFDQLEESYDYMMHRWILGSNYRLRNEPPFELYRTSEREEKGIDIYLPITNKGRKI